MKIRIMKIMKIKIKLNHVSFFLGTNIVLMKVFLLFI